LRCFTRQSNSTASGRRRQVAERGRPISGETWKAFLLRSR